MLPRTALIRKLSDLEPRLREVILLLLDEMERQRQQLAQQVTKTEFNELKAIVAELVEAQKRTEERVSELAEAQRRTEERVNELTEAQKRTEEEIKKLTGALRETKQRVEAISNTVGYTLEDRAIRSLPELLRAHGIEVEGRLTRKHIILRGKERQLNIYGHGRRDGKPVVIVGEAKVRPSRKEVDRFMRLVRQIEEHEGKEAVMVFVAYDFSLAMEAYLREQGILPIWSHELAL